MKNMHFGPFTLDDKSVLTREGEIINVPPKEMELLKLFLRHKDEIVNHAIIESEIWPRQTVSYASLARCVYSLRKILDDRKREMIITVPKRGYRFGLPVSSRSPQRILSTASKVAQANPKAYSHFLEAQGQGNIGKMESMQRAKKLFEKAHRIDPDYAVALSAISDCLIYESIRGYIHPDRAFRLGLAYSEQALQIDRSLASAHATHGWLYCVADDMAVGFVSLDKALSNDPGYAKAYTYLSFAQRAAGMQAESVANARKAVELDPHSVLNRHALVWRLFCSGMQSEALEVERKLLVDYPNDEAAHGMYGVIAAWMGKCDESLWATKRAIQLSDDNPMVMTTYTYALAQSGRNEEARTLADELVNSRFPRAPRPHLAMTYVSLGDIDQALNLLREARVERCPWFRAARYDPRLEELESDKRLVALYENQH